MQFLALILTLATAAASDVKKVTGHFDELDILLTDCWKFMLFLHHDIT